MTIDAVHALLKMNVVKVHCVLESIRIVGRNDRVLRIEQVPFPIAFENLAKHPTMPMKICELRPLELAVEFRGARSFKEVRFRPEPPKTRSFGIAVELLLLLPPPGIELRTPP